jgi:hypothetical protein
MVHILTLNKGASRLLEMTSEGPRLARFIKGTKMPAYEVTRCPDNPKLWSVRIPWYCGRYAKDYYLAPLFAISRLLPGLRHCRTAKERRKYADEWLKWCGIENITCLGGPYRIAD